MISPNGALSVLFKFSYYIFFAHLVILALYILDDLFFQYGSLNHIVELEFTFIGLRFDFIILLFLSFIFVAVFKLFLNAADSETTNNSDTIV